MCVCLYLCLYMYMYMYTYIYICIHVCTRVPASACAYSYATVPDIDMLEHLPQYLGGLFDMLSDPNKDIRQQAYAALAEFLREITQSISLGLVIL